MRKDMASNDAVSKHEEVACLSHTNNVVRGPNIGKVRAVDKVSQVACVSWRVRAGAFSEFNIGTADDMANGPRGGCIE